MKEASPRKYSKASNTIASKFTDEQNEELEKVFATSKTPHRNVIIALAKQFQMDTDDGKWLVNKWFHRARDRLKRQQRKTGPTNTTSSSSSTAQQPPPIDKKPKSVQQVHVDVPVVYEPVGPPTTTQPTVTESKKTSEELFRELFGDDLFPNNTGGGIDWCDL